MINFIRTSATTTDALIELCRRNLDASFNYEPTGADGLFIVTTPLLDVNNDYIQVQVRATNGRLVSLSDMGEALTLLNDAGAPYQQGEVRAAVDKLCAHYDVSIENGELCINTIRKWMASEVLAVAQCVAAVSSLSFILET